jgi:hypothetical protein
MKHADRGWNWWKTSIVAAVVTMAVGGIVMLAGNPTGASWLVGLNLVVVAALGLLVSAVGAWLADGDVKRPSPTADAPPARLVFVVRRDRADLFDQLTATLGTQENVHVVLDRRDRPRDDFDREVLRRGWSVARVRAR